MNTATVTEQVEQDYERQLDELAGSCFFDPLRFVKIAYPWGEPGTLLERIPGPDKWQERFLKNIGEEVRRNNFDGYTPVMPVQRAVSSGHGIGKGVMTAWLVNWIMVTRPNCQGVVTANTSTQLNTKTWAAVRRWTKMMLWAHWFTVNTQKMYHKANPESWFCSAQTCRAENSEAFAGQHAADSSSFYIFDEDSAIEEVIHEVAEGGMTDGEPFMFRFGNATRNNGSFYECCFGKQRDYWHPTVVDSRESRFSNKALIERWIEQHGEDSDFVRVRVRGLPPLASDLQYIDRERILEAQRREVVTFDDDPLIVGVDFSGGGQAWNVVRFRRGQDARSIPPVRVPGENTRKDRSAFLSVLANILADRRPERKVHIMFCDSAFGAPYVERLRSMGYTNVFEVNFGQTENPDEQHCANMRAYMWKQGREWLVVGGIPEDDEKLADDLGTPGSHLDRRDRLVIESKDDISDRGAGPIDDADAFLLTFAAPIAPRRNANPRAKRRQRFTGRTTPGSNKWTH